jgi:hypothetical protein
LAAGQSPLIDAGRVTPDLFGVNVSGQPGGCGRGQGLQRRAQRLADHLEAVEITHRGQHMGGIRALPTTRLDQSCLDQPVQQHVQRHTLQVMGDQPAAELRQHREVEPVVGQLQPQAVLPVDPPADRVRSLPVGEVLRVMPSTA